MSDEFTGDSGLKDDFDGTISAAEFEQSERGNWQLKLTVDCDDEDVQTFIYSVGGKDKGWTSYDGGETISGASAQSKFHDNSAIQKFIYVVMKIDGAGDELKTRSAKLYDRRGPFHAALWVGLRFHWDVVTEKGDRPPAEGQTEWQRGVDVQVCRPTRYLGVKGASVASSGNSSSATKTQENSSSPSSTTNTASDGSEISDGDLTTLTKLAAVHDSHEAFVDAVMEADSDTGQKFVRVRPVMKMITKKSFYDGLRA